MIIADIKVAAPLIRAEIEGAQNILRHLHPKPDSNSIGSTLAMTEWLSSLGKTVTLIQGDSAVPVAFSILPGVNSIVPKIFFEVDLNKFDLFLIQDTGALNQISKKGEVIFPNTLKTIIIDHHPSNTGFADVNLITSNYPATAQILYDLFKLWSVKIIPSMAVYLLIGLHGDTGGFIHPGINPGTFSAAANLLAIAPNYSRAVSELGNNREPEEIKFEAMMLANHETYFKNKLRLASISAKQMTKAGIEAKHTEGGWVSISLRSIRGCQIAGTLIEFTPGFCRVSLRRRDGEKYDVSKITGRLNGGGHKAAAGGSINKPFAEAKQELIKTILEVYSELNS